MIRIAVQGVAYFFIQALLLFGSAGTWDWPADWLYVGLQVVMVIVVSAGARNRRAGVARAAYSVGG